MRGNQLASSLWAATIVVSMTLIWFGSSAMGQQQRRGQNVPVKPLPGAQPKAGIAKPGDTKPGELKVPDAKAAEVVEPPLENVTADVSTRNVSVTSSFTGTEIVVFGAIDNSRQPSPESGLYDVVVVIEGTPSTVTARRKSRVAGIWLNTQSAAFDSVPSYYAIASTRPLDELAAEATLIGYEIGFDHVRMIPANKGERLPPAELKEFRKAVIRLKQKEGLYVSEPHGVAFIGRSLFRATVGLPATVTVGPFDTRVYLFRGERLISQYNMRLNLEREGLERYLHDFAFKWPFFYGLATVALALAAGLFASAVFTKSSH
jgi:uncharacterized protein (TIGR02186 family)